MILCDIADTIFDTIKDTLSRMANGLDDICTQVINDVELKTVDVLKTVLNTMKDIIYEAASDFIRDIITKILSIDFEDYFAKLQLNQLYFLIDYYLAKMMTKELHYNILHVKLLHWNNSN